MVKLKNPLLSLRASGTLGRALTFVRRRGRNIVEGMPTPTNADSPAQKVWRPMFSKCVDLWHLLSAAEKLAWESAARPLHMTGYAWFISQCLRPNPGIYLPLAGGSMTGRIDMGFWQLQNLPAPFVPNDAARKAYVDALESRFQIGARARRDAILVVGTGVATTVQLNIEDYDTNGIHSTTVNPERLTCRTAGKYLINAAIEFVPNATGFRILYVYTNATDIAIVSELSPSNAEYASLNCSTLFDLAVNDYVFMRAY
ncbi:hypothetical protein ES705_24868 [subsurface metagenome]